MTFKIHKMSLKSHFCCNMFRTYEAVIGQLLLDHYTAWAPRQYIYMLPLHVIIIQEYNRTSLMLFSIVC
jgi:hypothetical protein